MPNITVADLVARVHKNVLNTFWGIDWDVALRRRVFCAHGTLAACQRRSSRSIVSIFTDRHGRRRYVSSERPVHTARTTHAETSIHLGKVGTTWRGISPDTKRSIRKNPQHPFASRREDGDDASPHRAKLESSRHLSEGKTGGPEIARPDDPNHTTNAENVASANRETLTSCQEATDLTGSSICTNRQRFRRHARSIVFAA